MTMIIHCLAIYWRFLLMKKPDFKQMRIMLAKNEDPIAKEYILDKMPNDEVIYQFIKSFGSMNVPKVKI